MFLACASLIKRVLKDHIPLFYLKRGEAYQLSRALHVLYVRHDPYSKGGDPCEPSCALFSIIEQGDLRNPHTKSKRT